MGWGSATERETGWATERETGWATEMGSDLDSDWAGANGTAWATVTLSRRTSRRRTRSRGSGWPPS
jgi:hypothetical protein